MAIKNFLNMKSYLNGQALTIKNVAPFWNPPGENNTSDWISKVTKASGINENTEIDPNNEEMLIDLAHGLNYAEFTWERRGLPTVSEPDFVRGVRMAMGKDVPPKPAYVYRAELINTAVEALNHLKISQARRDRLKTLIFDKFSALFAKEDRETRQGDLPGTPLPPDDAQFGSKRY